MNDKKIILVIDDEVDLAEMIGFQLMARGFEVVTAHNGQEGLERLKTINPQLIILDMNMPKMGGIDFYKNICDSSANPRYPVFVLTARANMEKLFKDFNVAGFLAKPFEIGELVEKIEMIIADKGNAANTQNTALPDVLEKPAAKNNIKIDISLNEELVLTDSMVERDKAKPELGHSQVGTEGEKRQENKPDPKRAARGNKKILILENDIEAMRWLRSIFTHLGCLIEVAITPEECLKKTRQSTYDLIILKHFVEQTNTENLAGRIKEMPQFYRVPIIVYNNIWQKSQEIHPADDKEASVMLSAEGNEMLKKAKQFLM